MISFSLLFLFPASSFAQISPSSKINGGELTVSIESLNTAADKVSGTVEINNSSGDNYADIYFRAFLYFKKPTERFGRGAESYQVIGDKELISYQRGGGFTVKDGEKLSIPFTISYPQNIKTGEYSVSVELANAQGNEIAQGATDITLQGSGTFLATNIDDCYILIDNFKYLSTEGPNIEPDVNPEGYCKVTNTSSVPVNLSYKTAYAINSVIDNYSDLKEESSGEVATLAPLETRDIKITLPALQNPQVYSALVILTGQNGSVLSSILPFRWIVRGRSASISGLDLNKSYYQSGEQAVLTFTGGPSLDLSWRGVSREDYPNISENEGTDLNNPLLAVTIKNNLGQICAQTDFPLPKGQISWNDLKLGMPIDTNCPDPTVTAQIKDNDEVLAQSSKSYISSNKDKPAEGKQPFWQNSITTILVTVLSIVATAGIVFFVVKKRKPKVPPTPPDTTPPEVQNTVKAAVLFLIISLTLLARTVFAASTVTDRLTLPVNPFVPGAIIKNPINDSTVNTVNVLMQRNWHSQAGAFANVENFRENSATGSGAIGKSSVTVSPDCSKISITIKGNSGFTSACGNWGHGLAVFSYLDDREASPSALNSPNTIRTPIHQKTNGFLLYTPVTNGNQQPDLKKAQYEILTGFSPNNTQQHTLKVLFGSAELNKPLKKADSSFNTQFLPKDNNCGSPDKPCYGVLEYKFFCKETPPPSPPPACNTTCTTPADCQGARDGCTACLPNASGKNVCSKPPVCGDVCTTPADCQGIKDGCTQCVPKPDGSGNICQPPPPPACNAFCSTNNDCTLNDQGCVECVAGQCRVPPACNVACTKDGQCIGAKDGCTACVGGVCKIPPACNTTCTTPADCQGARDGCTACLPNDAGTGNVCRPTPACNVACTKDGQCIGAKDGCTACVGGVCKIPPKCGTACTTKAECSGVKDGCSQCLEGTCTDYNDNMCKCDGMVADMVYPSDSFNFEAFGKVEGANVKKAQIADVTFRLTKNNQVIAKSSPITPTVVESSANKLRVKASWSTPPPEVTKGATYRVFADVRCKPKRIIASGNDFSPISQASLIAHIPKPPPGLKMIIDGINKLAGEGNEQVKLITDKLLFAFDVSPAKAQTSNLQLRTLNFVKVLDTDNCRFVMFKYDETLF